MSRRRDDAFTDAVKGVRPLRGREKLRPEPAPGPADRSSASRRDPVSPPRFVVETQGAHTFARREDVARTRLADLRAGRTPVDREIDLHGEGAAAARRTLLAALADAQRDGARCVLVIHGAGLHSPDGPVLRDALPGWLLEGPLAREILAFSSAPASLGGRGASLVLLRRER